MIYRNYSVFFAVLAIIFSLNLHALSNEQKNIVKQCLNKPNREEINACLKLAAKKGDALAYLALAKIYDGYIKEMKNEVSAFDWNVSPMEKILEDYAALLNQFSKKYAVSHKNIEAKPNLVSVFTNLNTLVGFFHSEAAEYLQKASEMGDHEAQYLLSLRYESGKGLESNEQKAIDWLEQAVDGGYMPAFVPLARYYRSKGKNAYYKKAFMILQQAVNKGDITANVEIGKMYAEGEITESHISDREKAKLWYKKGVDAGDIYAYFEYGEILNYFAQTNEDHLEADAWIKKAAAGGVEKAIIKQCGINFSMPKEKACLIRLAHDGNGSAQRMLADSYSVLGLLPHLRSKDIVTPYVWCVITGNVTLYNDTGKIITCADELRPHMSKSQQNEAESKIMDWALRNVDWRRSSSAPGSVNF